jgi:predicted DCC family thiol-disulfide oxidoreductase YuxK
MATSIITAPSLYCRAKTWVLEPFKVSGTELPDNVLLLAKIVTFTFLATGQIKQLSSHFLPFFPIFDRIGSPAEFHWTLISVFLVAATALFFNRRVRLCCFVLSGVIVISLASSRLYFMNNRTFCACLLFLAGLSQRGEKPWLIRLQVVLLYFGAALNKLMEPDWRSGEFFAYWFGQLRQPELWAKITAVFPAASLARFFCWTTILVELSLMVGFIFPKTYSWAIWLGAAFHTALLFFVNSLFGMFYFAILATYLVFVDWPEAPVEVLYDGDCGFCDRTRQLFETLDLNHVFTWIPFQSTDRWHGVSEQQLREKVHLFSGDKVYSGFSAFKVLVLFNPLVYFCYIVILARQPNSLQYDRWLAPVVLAVFTPWLSPIGDAVYGWVARHRYMLGSRACARRNVA